MNTILLIDDDKDLCSIIKKYMDRAGYITHLSYTGSNGLHLAKELSCQLIILDIMLPDLHGFYLLSELRKTSTVPILMLTAIKEETDKLHGLRSGADDYLTKPFSMNELLARAEALIRRYTKFNCSNPEPQILYLKTLSIDCNQRTVILNHKQIELTGLEFDLLYFLASHKGQIFTKKQLYTQVWGGEYAYDDNNIMSFLSKLRKKIEPDREHPFYIQTIRGVGYRFNQEA